MLHFNSLFSSFMARLPAQGSAATQVQDVDIESGTAISSGPHEVNLHPKPKGKLSKIAEYCRRAINNGREECIWLCIHRNGRYIVRDIPLTTNGYAISLYDVRKRCNWWKRHSLYSAVGVREVEICFLHFNGENNEISVAHAEFDYNDRIARLDGEIKSKYDMMEIGNCTVDVMGNSPCTPKCNGKDQYYCKVTEELCCLNQDADFLSKERESYKWLPGALKFFWQNGINADGQQLLRDARFITRYEDLEYDKFSNAKTPYGKTVRAFMLVEGWHIRYLLVLIAAGLVCSICAVAIGTAVGNNLDMGLTAGSYTCALATAFIAVFTFLSAVL